ncbi:MAG: Protein of uncharacterized function [Gemmatimonadetes bacterium]|nr:Protein of uncharacterized function [Gemmatimonadota bacterium]
MRHALLNPAVVASYEAARYEVYGDEPAVLMVRDAAGIHDEWLAANRATNAVVITAWNPFGQQISPLKNQAANRHLLQSIESRALRWVPARGADASGTWAEDSFCVFDVAHAQVEHWLVTYQQNAALCIRTGEPARLVWHMRFDP